MLGARPPLVGDPLQGCGPGAKTCTTDAACGPGGVCLDGLCSRKCSNAEADCLHNEVCKDGTCKRICSSSGQCADGTVCIDRTCESGCSSDEQCGSNEVCSKGNCVDPCSAGQLGTTACGECARCETNNHILQCSCPANTIGDPYHSCRKNNLRWVIRLLMVN